MTPIFSLCAAFWLLAVFVVNMVMTGETRRQICSLLRFLLLCAFLAFRLLIQMGNLTIGSADFQDIVSLCAIVACGHFFASDFTMYIKEQTPAAARSAVVSASATLLLMVLICFLALRIIP